MAYVSIWVHCINHMHKKLASIQNWATNLNEIYCMDLSKNIHALFYKFEDKCDEFIALVQANSWVFTFI